MTDTQPNVSFFKKGKSRPSTNRRLRSVSPSNNARTYSSMVDQASVQKSQVVIPSKKKSSHLLAAGTKRSVAQRDDLDDIGDNGPDVKWTAAGSHQQVAQDILDDDEAQELLEKQEKKRKIVQDDDDDENVPDDGLYHGQAGYKKHVKKNKEIPKAMRVGPQRSTNTIKTVTVFDYQPDVCKDYKETGYCGFGDTCKFLHDRGTYLAGWQLDKFAAEPKKQIQDDSDSDSDEDIPFACLICRNPFTDPVVTRCGHYYCSKCAIKRYTKNPKCLACGTPTGGIFNRADKILAKMRKKETDLHDEGDQPIDKFSDVKLEGLREDNEDSKGSDAESG